MLYAIIDYGDKNKEDLEMVGGIGRWMDARCLLDDLLTGFIHPHLDIIITVVLTLLIAAIVIIPILVATSVIPLIARTVT